MSFFSVLLNPAATNSSQHHTQLSTQHRFRTAAFSFLLLLVLGACRAPVPLPLATTTEASLLTREQLVAALEQRATNFTSSRALAVTRVQIGKSAQTVRYVILCQKPEKLRLEALPLQGVATLQLFVTDGASATFLDVGEKTAYQSRNVAQILDRALQLPLTVTEVCEILTAAPNLSRLQEPGNGLLFEDALQQKMFLSKDSSIVLMFRADNLLSEWQIRDVGGNSKEATITYRWDAAEGTLEGLTLTLEGKATITMDFARLVENPQLAENLFVVAIPSSYHLDRR